MKNIEVYGEMHRYIPYLAKNAGFDRFGNEQTYDVQGFPAVAFCHEIDHLDGILFKDKKTDEPVDK